MSDSSQSQTSKQNFLQFDIESIREIAQLLRESELGEISLETTIADQPTQRLSLRRAGIAAAPQFYNVPEQVAAGTANGDQSTLIEASEVVVEAGPTLIPVTALAVGVFREAKVTVAVGDEIKAKQVLGCVESLRVPNEIVATSAGRVLEIFASEGQGIEYGQTLFVIEEL